MTPYILPISETDTKLRALMTRTQHTHNLLLLTSEETAEPIAVVMKIDAYEQVQRQQQRLYQLQLLQLKQWLDRVEQQWENHAVREECIAIWQNSIMPLWEVCPEPARGLCASLALSIKFLKVDTLSKEQVAALRYSIKLLQSTVPDRTEIENAYQQLIESGIPPMVAFDETIIQSYLDEL